MPKLQWDQLGERLYETGIDRGVIYTGETRKGEAWNGLTGFDESPSGAEPNKQYANNINYLTIISAETFGGTINAFTYPDSFAACNGEVEHSVGVLVGQQVRESFDFTYRTLVGNDIKREGYGYKLHLVYGCTVQPSAKTRETIGETPEAVTMSWEVSTTPVEVPGLKPSATIVIDSTKIPANILAKIEDVLYGTEEAEAKMLSPKDLFELIAANAGGGTGEEENGQG